MPLGANKAAIMGVSGVSTGPTAPYVVLLSTQTATGDSSLSFTSNIDSTYGEYIFRFYNCNPETPQTFKWQVDDDAGNNGYNDFNLVTTYWESYFGEAGTGGVLGYIVGQDTLGTTYDAVSTYGVGSDADQSCAGEFHLFNPSSTTYAKHYHARAHSSYFNEYAIQSFSSGYINTTTAINAVDFKFTSGNFDGVIKMWGVKS
tara:strand:- start:411 stop:1016 length:606 start_codon:yes stop_codon:yes gene_type:complete